MANPIVRDDIVLDQDEQEIENASEKPIIDIRLDTQIKEWIDLYNQNKISLKM